MTAKAKEQKRQPKGTNKGGQWAPQVTAAEVGASNLNLDDRTQPNQVRIALFAREPVLLVKDNEQWTHQREMTDLLDTRTMLKLAAEQNTLAYYSKVADIATANAAADLLNEDIISSEEIIRLEQRPDGSGIGTLQCWLMLRLTADWMEDNSEGTKYIPKDIRKMSEDTAQLYTDSLLDEYDLDPFIIMGDNLAYVLDKKAREAHSCAPSDLLETFGIEHWTNNPKILVKLMEEAMLHPGMPEETANKFLKGGKGISYLLARRQLTTAEKFRDWIRSGMIIGKEGHRGSWRSLKSVLTEDLLSPSNMTDLLELIVHHPDNEEDTEAAIDTFVAIWNCHHVSNTLEGKYKGPLQAVEREVEVLSSNDTIPTTAKFIAKRLEEAFGSNLKKLNGINKTGLKSAVGYWLL